MKFSSISTVRSSASALILAGSVFLGVSGIAHAQGSSGSAQSGGSPADYTDKKDPIKGHTGEGYATSPEKRSPKDKHDRYQTESPTDYSDKQDPIKGHTGEGYASEKSKAASTTPSGGKQIPADYSDRQDPIKGHTGDYHEISTEKSKAGATGPIKQGQKDKYYGMPKEKEEMDTGYVDQKKKAERATDPRSPSPDPHVPDFPKDKAGKPMKDLKDEQGGSIGPN